MTALQHASPMESFQLFVATIGVVFAVWNVWTAFQNTVAMTNTPANDLRRLLAIDNMQQALLERLVAHQILMLIGVASVLLPPPSATTPDMESEIQQAFFTRIGLVFLTIVLAGGAMMKQRQHWRFMKKAGEQGPIASVITQGREVAQIPVHETVVLAPRPIEDHPNEPKAE